MARNIVEYLDVPMSEEAFMGAFNENLAMKADFKMTNESSFENIPQYHRKLIVPMQERIIREFDGVVESVYLVGSLGRADYEEDYSDVNLFIIIYDSHFSPEQCELVRGAVAYYPKMRIKMFSKSNFLAQESEKYRLIAKVDGLLLHGKDLLEDEEIPKAGLLTALVLNDDMMGDLDEAQRWLVDNQHATSDEISAKSRILAKRIIDFLYGIVMSNKPQYTSSRPDRVMQINSLYPENKEMVDILVGISRYGVGELQSLGNMIEGFRPVALENLEKMRLVRAGIKESK